MGHFPEVTAVTTCMNREEFLYQSLPTWLPWVDSVIVVDWSSDIPVRVDLPNVKVIREEGKSQFWPCYARNRGAREIKSKYVLFIDSDIQILDISKIDFQENLFYSGMCGYITGTCLVSMKDFIRVDGYNEEITIEAAEDGEFYERLINKGCRQSFLEFDQLKHIDHSFELRVRHRPYSGSEFESRLCYQDKKRSINV